MFSENHKKQKKRRGQNRKKEQGQQIEIVTNMVNINPVIPIITLNANGLNEPIKRDCQTVSENTTHLPIYCLQDTHLKFKDV